MKFDDEGRRVIEDDQEPCSNEAPHPHHGWTEPWTLHHCPGVPLTLCDVCKAAGIDQLARGEWSVDGGCIVLPGQGNQNLCAQHEVTCEPLGIGGAILIRNLNGVGAPA